MAGEITGKLVPCPACGKEIARLRKAESHRQRARQLRLRLRKYSQMIGRARTQTFKSFVLTNVSPTVREAYLAAQKFAQHPQGWLVLSGSKGTGKSHLAAAVANYQEQLPENQRPTTLFFITSSLLDMLRSGYGQGDYDDVMGLCKSVELLILDDLGAEQDTAWARDKMFQIINYRYQGELPLLVVTNNLLSELDPRIADRLSDDDFSVRVAVYAPSYRQRRSNPGAIID